MNDIVTFLNSLRWQDFVDILLNSYIIFRLYVLFRGSRLIRVVPIIAMLWPIKFMAISMGLVVTNWAIQGVIATAAIIIIIVFRDEIASAFNFKNPLSLFWGTPSSKNETAIDIISQSMFNLGNQRIGALLVLPGQQRIEEYIQGGVEWEGKISEQMLTTIFWDKNPVHDGAALIKENRISHVSVILPLSKQKHFPSKYGTRHRAAAGMCEVSDALVIAVSEERGDVTVAKDGKLQDVKTVERLRAYLAAHAGVTEKRGLINWKAMVEFGLAGVICFSLVTGIWFGLSRGKEMLKTITVPIEYTDIKQGFDIIKTSANEVELQLSGSMPLMKSLDPKTIKVLLKLGETTMGKNEFVISTDNLTLPPGVNLKKVDPESVALMMGGIAHRNIPVQIDWSGKLAENLILETAVPDPEFVTVTGVSPGLDEVITLYTEKIPLESIRIIGTGEIQAEIALFPDTLKLAKGQQQIEIRYVTKERPPSETQE